MKPQGVLVAAIDDAQQRELNFLLSNAFSSDLLGVVSVRSNPSGRPTQSGYAVSHEYLLFAGKSDESKIQRLPPTAAQMARFTESDKMGPFEWRNLRREGQTLIGMPVGQCIIRSMSPIHLSAYRIWSGRRILKNGFL